jgi:hypothetical protein
MHVCRVFHDLSEIFARTADELLPPPVFPTFDLSIPVGQLPPSLPFTDPVIPDMHPTPYLFALHRVSLQRANQLLAIRLFHTHQVTVARKLFEAEVERIEDEYEGATKGVVERLLEGVEERRKRLNEEKEGEGVSLGAFHTSPHLLRDGADLQVICRHVLGPGGTSTRYASSQGRTIPREGPHSPLHNRIRLSASRPSIPTTIDLVPPRPLLDPRPVQSRLNPSPSLPRRSPPLCPRGVRLDSRGRAQAQAWPSSSARSTACALYRDERDVQSVWKELDGTEWTERGGSRWGSWGVQEEASEGSWRWVGQKTGRRVGERVHNCACNTRSVPRSSHISFSRSQRARIDVSIGTCKEGYQATENRTRVGSRTASSREHHDVVACALSLSNCSMNGSYSTTLLISTHTH